MKVFGKTITQLGIIWLICLGLLGLTSAWASEGNIDTTYKYAWSEKFRVGKTSGPPWRVTVNDTYLSGYAWPRTSAG